MTTLTDFKNRLRASVSKPGVRVQSTILNSRGEVTRKPDPAPVGGVRSNDFFLLRDGRPSFTQFGKAGAWSFADQTATLSLPYGDQVLFTFLDA